MEYPFKDLLPLDEVLAREGYYKDWTHLDPEVFYSLTQISNFIKTKGYGVDVRLLIAQLAEHFGLKTTQVVDLANLLQQKFTNLQGVTQSFTNNINSLVAQMEADKDAVIANATVDSEVILARGGKPTLQARLDETTAQLAQTVSKVNEGVLEINSKTRITNPSKSYVVFRSDDGHITEYTKALPVFSSRNAPQTIAIVSDSVGKPERLSQAQLLELQDVHGWEITSHSKTHPTSQRPPLIQDLTYDEMRIELKHSRDALRNMGLKVESYFVVGGMYRTRERLVMKELYRASAHSWKARYSNGINTSPIQTHDMTSTWFDTQDGVLKNNLDAIPDRAEAIAQSLNTMYEYIDEVTSKGGILIIGTHWHQHSLQEDIITAYGHLIDYAKSKTSVTTLSEALDGMGNIIEVGDFADNDNPERSGGNHFVVGYNGKTSGTLNLRDYNEYDGSTDWRSFPKGVTYNSVSADKAVSSGLPSGKGGVLETHKYNVLSTTLYSFNYQIFRPVRGSGEYYIRYFEAGGTFSEWESIASGVTRPIATITTPPSAFKMGISHNTVASASAPFGQGGVLETKIISQSAWGYNYQEFTATFFEFTTHRRRALSASEWGPWVAIKP